MLKRNFKNYTEAAFYDYLGARGYAEGTTWEYVRRVRNVEDINKLISSDIDLYIDDYETGSKENLNSRSHKAYSNALKRLKEYMIDKRINSF